MWTVKIDDKIIYDYRLLTTLPEQYIIGEDAKLILSKNEAGSFTFSTPYKLDCLLMQSIVKVYYNDVLKFRGRIIKETQNFLKSYKYVCEGDLAFLNDSIQTPYNFPLVDAETFISGMLTDHNVQMVNAPEKQFEVGQIGYDPSTVVNADSYEPRTTFNAVAEFLNSNAGIIQVREEGDKHYIDYFPKIETVCNQPILLRSNLLSYKKNTDGKNFITGFLPVVEYNGYMHTPNEFPDFGDEQIDEIIKRGDIFYLTPFFYRKHGISPMGNIIGTGVFRLNVAEGEEVYYDTFYDIAEAEIMRGFAFPSSIDITAADLSKAGYTQYEAFDLTKLVEVYSPELDVKGTYEIERITLNLFKPSSDKIVVGAKNKSGISNIITGR